MQNIGYTYCIKFKPTGQVYYGSRCCKTAHPSEFWVSYFTSSKLVHSMIKAYGKDSFEYEIRRTFDNPKDAQLWERRVLSRMDAGRRQDFLNKSNGVAPILSGWKNPFYGRKHNDNTKEKMSLAKQGLYEGKNNPNWKGGIPRKKYSTEQERQKVHSEYMKQNNPMNNPESVAKLSQSALARKKTECTHCGKLFEPGGFKRHQNTLIKKGLL